MAPCEGELDHIASVIRAEMFGIRIWPGCRGSVTLQRAPLRAVEEQRVGRAMSESLGMLTCHSDKTVKFRSTAESKVRGRFNLLFAVALKRSYISFCVVTLEEVVLSVFHAYCSYWPRQGCPVPSCCYDRQLSCHFVYKILLNPHPNHFNREDEAACFSEILATQPTST
jgi:hypothetical protein